MIHFMILRVIAKQLIPFILIFGLYVQFHGDFGPGGGFQAGVIIAVAFILYALIYGVDIAEKVVPQSVSLWGLATGVLLYIGTGLVSFLNKGEFLNYSVLSEEPVAGQHLGIAFVELGVGVTVTFAMISIFFALARNRR